ncbi:hypothetical protein KDA_49350 [Dictyobacter alpinus]|uniref:Uncharacterized protein n=2 Tax=Dictyobacter alpinus TaxID=2014873 RepID=A0A402BDG7_9CHLR|nr:hypothetical protein KDA_49350 [Dictyobacter alpinus]
MHPLAELSPIDPQIMSATMSVSNTSARLSSEDIRAFRLMAEQWFQIESKADGLELLQLLCQRIFPPSLAGFFRADQLLEQVAQELLQIHLPAASEETVQHIMQTLLRGYHDHSYAITRQDASELGLNIAHATIQEEQLLWTIWQQSRSYLAAAQTQHLAPGSRIDALIASSDFFAHHVVMPQSVIAVNKGSEENREHTSVPMLQLAHWDILRS